MEDPFSRARMLLGDEAMERLGQAGVAVFGLGGVGGAAAEALGWPYLIPTGWRPPT